MPMTELKPQVKRKWVTGLTRSCFTTLGLFLFGLPACGQSGVQTNATSSPASPTTSGQGAADTEPLRRLNASVESLIKKVSPSVVQILVSGYGAVDQGIRNNADVLVGRERSIGSGFVIDPAGYIVTNAHVVSGAYHVDVVLPFDSIETTPNSSLNYRGNVVPGRVVGVAQDIDLAIIKVEAKNLTAIPLANYGDLLQGELVFAFGSPGGLRNSVSMGVVSATARQTDPDSPMVYIQTDAPINPGNSGGPLVNVNGELVGVNTFILSQSGGNEGLGFAIPSSIVNISFQQIEKYGHVHRGEIGIGLQTITSTLASALNLPQDSGVVVSDVLPGTPADISGMHVGDVIVRIDGTPVDNLPYFSFRLLTHDAGEKVHLEVLRGPTHLNFDVTVAERPHQIDQIAALTDPRKGLIRRLGIIGVEIDPKIAAELSNLRSSSGILVVARSADSTAEVPLSTGDVIHSLNGVPMTTISGVRQALDAIRPGTPVAIQIERDGRLAFVTFTTDQP